ncbi:MAG: hypothetical protein WCI78_12660 [Mycobacterium sp.]
MLVPALVFTAALGDPNVALAGTWTVMWVADQGACVGANPGAQGSSDRDPLQHVGDTRRHADDSKLQRNTFE